MSAILSISFILVLVPLLVNVAFLTLLERKVLSYSQIRKGPNKVSFIGLLQPMADVLKLFTKELSLPMSSNLLMFIMSPMMNIFLTMTIIFTIPISEVIFPMKAGWLMILLLLSLGVYPMIISGWSSNSKYSFLGSIRSVAQSVTYELVLMILLFIFLMMSKNTETSATMNLNSYFPMLISMPFIYILWIMTCITETNRTPFDFSEGESELVSGFNTEYSGGKFALIFMSEYLSIIFLSIISAALICHYSGMMMFIIVWMNCFIWIWLRATFPRHRYDLMMLMSWKSIIPSVSNILLILMMMNMMLFM